MLFTRCPDCNTTFRITPEALGKAAGQVRCGRCACVFDAYTALTEHETAPEQTGAQTGSPGESSPDEPAPAPAAPQRAAPASPAPAASVGRAAAATQPADDDAFDGMSVADVVAGIEAVSDEAEETAAARQPVLSDSEPTAKAPAADGSDAPPGSPDWHLLPEPQQRSRAARIWLAASVAAAAALGLQITHHFRADIAGTAFVGPLLQDVYALLGSEVIPHWDLNQYRIVDWVATGEPNANGRGSLKITARIQNRGPQSQPYPHIHVQLMDRWDSAVGSRIFEPAEYMPARTSWMMSPGATAKAELDVVDPGPDAYGFELDLCVEGNGKRLRCGADNVFTSM